MTVTVEDGTRIAGANSYDSVANIESFALARGVTLTGTETLIHKFMDWLEAQPFQGQKFTKDQSLQWPRMGVVIDNWPVTTATIPQLLKDVEAIGVMELFAGNNPNSAIPRQTKGVKVGPIAIDYADDSAPYVITPALSNALSKLLGSGSDGFEFNVTKDGDNPGLNYYDDLGWMR